MEDKELAEWKKAGEAAAKISEYARKIIRPGMPLLEIAERLEEEAIKLNVKWAFPVNLSINEIAAHYSPQQGDTTIAEGLLKVDLGMNVNGFISDTAFSLDLTKEQKFKKMIKVNENALKDAIKTVKSGEKVSEIGRAIHDSIVESGFSPVRNLSGHQIERYSVHAGLTIPNYDNKNQAEIEEGRIYAIEPFATTGEGIVQDGKPSGIYMLKELKPARDKTTRDILRFIAEEYKTLPFSARWIVNKFGIRALMSLNVLEQQEILYQFTQLIEKSRAPVSQAEHTILVEKDKVTILTA